MIFGGPAAIAMPPILILVAGIALIVGALVGGWLTTAIERLPWEQSPIWPCRRKPGTLEPMPWRGYLPWIGPFLVGGPPDRLRRGLAVELVTGGVFAAFALVETTAWLAGDSRLDSLDRLAAQLVFDALLVSVLIVATFIDWEHQIIPSPITDVGMAGGLILGTIFPFVRPAPETAASWSEGLLTGLHGLAVGGGIVLVTRILGGVVFRREAMGLGDLTLLAAIGSFLGWRAAILTFFGSAFVGLGHSLFKILSWLFKTLAGRPTTRRDREMALGPYLALAALLIALNWQWVWNDLARFYFEELGMVWLFVVHGADVPPLVDPRP